MDLRGRAKRYVRGMSRVREDIRGTTRVCPGYEGMSGVREDIRGMSKDIRDTRVCPGYERISGVCPRISGV